MLTNSQIHNTARYVRGPVRFELITKNYLLFVRCFAWIPNVDTGKMEKQEGRLWLLSDPQFTDPTQIVQTIFAAMNAFQEHELRETFTYKGARVFSPHDDLDERAQYLNILTHADEDYAEYQADFSYVDKEWSAAE